MKSFKTYLGEKFTGNIAGRRFGHKAGFWLSPKGELVGTSSVHVKDIIDNPSKFGLSDSVIQSIYGKHGEPVGMEGDAREELISMALTRGWIRVRKYSQRATYWSVTVNSLDRKTKETIESWVNAFLEEGIMGRGTEIRILEMRSDRLKLLEVGEIQRYGLEEGTNTGGARTLFESTIEAQPDLEVLDESSLSRIWRKVQAHTCGAISGYRDERTRSENNAANRLIKQYLLGKGYSVTAVEGNYIENANTKKFIVAKDERGKTLYLSFQESGSDPVWTDKVNIASVFADQDMASRMADKYGGEPKRHVKEVVEPSFFVCNHKVDGPDGGELEKDLFKMGVKTDQDSVLIVPAGGKSAYLLGTSKREDGFPPYRQKEVVGSGRYGRAAGEFLSRIRGRAFAFEEIEGPSTRNGKWGHAALAKRIDAEFREEDNI
jgi:hypothetical protein